MTSSYLQRPTREWCEAQRDQVAATQVLVSGLRTTLEGAESLAKQIKDRCTDGDSLARADEMVELLTDVLPDYLVPLENALREESEEAERQCQDVGV